MTVSKDNWRTGLIDVWKKLDSSWRWALGGVLIASLFWGLWSSVILRIMPLAVNNTFLYNEPIFTAFNLQTSETYLYQRTVQDQLLSFRPVNPSTLMDFQSGSQWDLESGRAVEGALMGEVLKKSTISAEDIFPYQGVKAHQNPRLAIWQRFDTNWYLKIAERGYSNDGSTAFFPIYPFLVRLFAFVVKDVVLASRLVALLALIAALALFYKIATEYADRTVANRAILYWLIFPTAFFLFASYTESSYLLFILASFFYARRKKWIGAAVFGILAALTRIVGFTIFIPLLYMWWVQNRPRRWRDAFAILLIPIVTGIYLLPTLQSSLLPGQWHPRLVFPWEHFSELGILITNHLVSSIDIFNTLATILFGVLCIIIFWKMPLELGFYSVLMFIPSLLRLNPGQPFVSMMRYVLVIFPAFILLGKWGEKIWVNRAIVYLSFPLALYFSAQFWLWGWVG